MSCFWLHQQSCWSPWYIPPWQKLCWGLSWGKWDKSTPWQELHRLSLFLAKVEQSSKHKWFSYCCIPLVSFRVWKWFFCQFCPDLQLHLEKRFCWPHHSDIVGSPASCLLISPLICLPSPIKIQALFYRLYCHYPFGYYSSTLKSKEGK